MAKPPWRVGHVPLVRRGGHEQCRQQRIQQSQRAAGYGRANLINSGCPRAAMQTS